MDNIKRNITLMLTTVVISLVGVLVLGGFDKTAPYGANGSAERYNPIECINGYCHASYSMAMTKATSTPCTFKSPSATSTIGVFQLRVSSSTAVTATTYTLASSTLQNATTSPITYFGTGTSTQNSSSYAQGTTTVPAGSQVTLSYSPGANQGGIISPNTYITLGVQGGTGIFGTSAQVGGYCNLQLDIVN